MSDKFDLILEKIFGVDFNRDTADIIDDLKGKITSDKELELEESIDEDKGEVILTFNPNNKDDQITNLLIAAGLPNEQFDKAESLYCLKYDENGAEYKYNLTGKCQGGAYAQYAGLMASNSKVNQQIVTYNSVGIGPFLRFNGNEFLGYKLGLLYYFNKTFKVNSYMDLIYDQLLDEGVIEDGNISSRYRDELTQSLKVDQLKETLVKILDRLFDLGKSDIKDQIEESFNPYIIERKMRLIDKYKSYRSKPAEKSNFIINYIMSDNIPARLFQHAGPAYLVDKDFRRFSGGLGGQLIKRIDRLEDDQLDSLIKHRNDLFEPFILLKPGANGRTARSRQGTEAKVGSITNNLSIDYLAGLIKDIILGLKKKDKEILVHLFKGSRDGSAQFLKMVKDRLRHSMRLQQKLDKEINFESRYFSKNGDLLGDDDKIYPLDQVAINQLTRMSYLELKELWSWDLTGEGIFLNLGKKLADDEEAIEFHSSISSEKFTNEEERLTLDLNLPSLNKVYGSLKQTRYLEKYDTEYLDKEADIYQFPADQGVGFEILSKHTDLERSIKVNGSDISGVYDEVDELDGKEKWLGEKYFGDNFIFKTDDKRLIYLYGSKKDNRLIIDGFKNGDYGIEIVEKIKEKAEESGITYTAHKVKFDNFEFVSLEQLEIKRSIYDHTKVYIRGVITEEMVEEYQKYLMKEDPKLIITYKEDDRNILFKGIIEKYRLIHHNFDYSLELEAKSYSVLLERARIDRVFQNQGTTYNDVFSKLSSDNDLFKINFSDSSIGDVELLSEEYPLVLQYEEYEWSFIKRLSSYLGQIVLVDDTKDDSETINIQVGPHTVSAKDLNNISGTQAKRTDRGNHIYYYNKVYSHPHHRSDDIFGIGTKVNYKVDNESDDTVEMLIIKNRIFLYDGDLYSDLTLVKEDELSLRKERRMVQIEGRSFRGEVKKVNTDYQAKISFLDLEDDFEEGKAHWFPIDKIYKGAHFTPEVGDIVDVYFKNRNEGCATVKSCTTDNEQEYDHNPADKLIMTPGGYQMKLNNEEVLFASKEDKSQVNLKEEEITLESNESSMRMDKKAITLQCKDSSLIFDKSVVELTCGGKGLKVSDGEIKLG